MNNEIIHKLGKMILWAVAGVFTGVVIGSVMVGLFTAIFGYILIIVIYSSLFGGLLVELMALSIGLFSSTFFIVALGGIILKLSKPLLMNLEPLAVLLLILSNFPLRKVSYLYEL